MMKTLPQIVTTFLAVGATFIAAYLVYLYSSQANIDEKIQIKGSKIVSLIKKAPTYKLHLWSNDYYLVKAYKEKYPNKSLIFIYEKISNDLMIAIHYTQKVQSSILASFEKNNSNSKGPILGRIYLNLMRKSVDYLSPREIWWPGRWGSLARGNLLPTPKEAELFPFGPLGVEKWSDDFRIIRNYTNSLYYYKHMFLNDLQSFINQSDDEVNYNKSNYKEWIDNTENLLSNIENENYQIQSLLRLRQRYSIEARLPNVSWISTLGIFSFISGVAIPLIIIGLRAENSIPSTVNIVFFITTFALLIGSIVLIGKDILSPHKSEVHIKYFLPLKRQLLDYKNTKHLVENYDCEIVNQLLDEKKSLKLPQRLIESLETYRKIVIENKTYMDDVADLISKDIKQNDVLRSYKADPQSSGQWVSIISLLSLDGRKNFFEKLEPNFIFQIGYDGGIRDIYKIKSPSNKTQLKEIESEFNKIYDNCLKQENVQSYNSKRKTLEEYRDKLLVEITELTGK